MPGLPIHHGGNTAAMETCGLQAAWVCLSPEYVAKRERVWDIAAEDPPGLLEVSGSKGSHLPQQERVGMDKTDVLGEDS